MPNVPQSQYPTPEFLIPHLWLSFVNPPVHVEINSLNVIMAPVSFSPFTEGNIMKQFWT